MSENHDRGRRRTTGKVGLQPFELLGPKIAHPARLQVSDIDQRDKMNTAMIEAVPTCARAALAETVEECLAPVGIEHVMLTRDVEDWKPQFFQHLFGVIELLIARQLRDVTGVDEEIGVLRQWFDLGDRLSKCGQG